LSSIVPLEPDFLDFIERDLVGAPIVESGRPGGLVISHLLGDLELSPVLQIRSDPCGPECVTADLGLDAGACCPPTNQCGREKVWTSAEADRFRLKGGNPRGSPQQSSSVRCGRGLATRRSKKWRIVHTAVNGVTSALLPRR
jgi:hypothetical protein